MSHNSTALAQLSAANTRKTEENRSHINKIVAPHFTADVCVKIATRQRYVSGKPLLTHPFKLKQTADLCVRSGEVMVFLTIAPYSSTVPITPLSTASATVGPTHRKGF